MSLKLKSRELPMVTFRRVLPEFLGPGKGRASIGKDADPVECFIEIDARAGGAVNPEHVSLIEKSMLNARVMTRKGDKIEDDNDFIVQDHENALAINRQRFAALYNGCVIEWRSNIQVENDEGGTTDITCDLEAFLDLADVRVPEIASALVDFEKEVMVAGTDLVKDDKDMVKN